MLRGMKQGIIALAAIAALSVAGCATQQEASSKPTVKPSRDVVKVTHAVVLPTPTVQQPANPVALLRPFTGCKVPAGETVGTVDANGGLVASCDYVDNAGQNGTDVTAYTVTTEGQLQQLVNSLLPDDSHRIIVGPGFIIEVTGDWPGYSSHLTTADIAGVAARLHGQVRDAG